MFDTPILYLIFNRPDHIQTTFEHIRAIKPKKLFIAADGPRKNIPNEDKICKQARELVLNAIDWECEINTLFRDTNLGCGNAVYQAINWFFSHVSMGIILEDDCVPNKSFFNFCQKMLDLHKDRDEVMHISGTWYLSEQKEDYIISKHPFVWGWATWKRAWEKYDFELHNDSFAEIETNIFLNLNSAQQTTHWLNSFKHLTNKGWNFTWDYQWIYTIWKYLGVTISPTKNLISNIGFNENATHTTQQQHYLANVPTHDFETNDLKGNYSLNKKLDKEIFEHYFVGKKQVVTKPKPSIRKKTHEIIRKILIKLLPELNQIPPKSNAIESFVSNKSKVYPPFTIYNSRINKFSYLARNSFVNNTKIGRYCSIGPNLIAGWGIHPTNGISTSPMFYSTQKQNGFSLTDSDKIEETKPIIIGNDVFIGMNVTILDGIKIGNGAVIGAGAVVSKDIPDYAIAVGNPIKIIRYRFNDEAIKKLKEIKWWDWDIDKLNEIEKHFFSIDTFLENYS